MYTSARVEVPKYSCVQYSTCNRAVTATARSTTDDKKSVPFAAREWQQGVRHEAVHLQFSMAHHKCQCHVDLVVRAVVQIGTYCTVVCLSIFRVYDDLRGCGTLIHYNSKEWHYCTRMLFKNMRTPSSVNPKTQHSQPL